MYTYTYRYIYIYIYVSVYVYLKVHAAQCCACCTYPKHSAAWGVSSEARRRKAAERTGRDARCVCACAYVHARTRASVGERGWAYPRFREQLCDMSPAWDSHEGIFFSNYIHWNIHNNWKQHKSYLSKTFQKGDPLMGTSSRRLIANTSCSIYMCIIYI